MEAQKRVAKLMVLGNKLEIWRDLLQEIQSVNSCPRLSHLAVIPSAAGTSNQRDSRGTRGTVAGHVKRALIEKTGD